MEIKIAGMNDLEGILALHKRYHVTSISPEDKPDGFVTTNFTQEQLQALIEQERGITIAKDGDTVIAYAMAASWQFWSAWPLFIHMIQKLPEHSFNGQALSVENSYQYGPICVDKLYRSTGVFDAIFYASLASMVHRYPIMITFINKINPRSYAAHTKKVTMDTVCTFQFNNNDYYMLACPTNQKPA
ncbi:GNAT family acetyltransferase [Desulfovibrio cuneatus]|uniref:GNAT family acetyltransferase n=1 Tax=Desulfovibrio cuneatus TaxID=159728 RepID=UPI00047F4941|nr:GNAT family acetyltransferase [Desulfovibrio cuneatus]